MEKESCRGETSMRGTYFKNRSTTLAAEISDVLLVEGSTYLICLTRPTARVLHSRQRSVVSS